MTEKVGMLTWSPALRRHGRTDGRSFQASVRSHMMSVRTGTNSSQTACALRTSPPTAARLISYITKWKKRTVRLELIQRFVSHILTFLSALQPQAFICCFSQTCCLCYSASSYHVNSNYSWPLFYPELCVPSKPTFPWYDFISIHKTILFITLQVLVEKQEGLRSLRHTDAEVPCSPSSAHIHHSVHSHALKMILHWHLLFILEKLMLHRNAKKWQKEKFPQHHVSSVWAACNYPKHDCWKYFHAKAK